MFRPTSLHSLCPTVCLPDGNFTFPLTCQAISGDQDSIHEVSSAWSYSAHPLPLGRLLILQVSDHTTLPLGASLDPLRFPEMPCWLLTECLPGPDYSTCHPVPVVPAYQSSVSVSPKGQS